MALLNCRTSTAGISSGSGSSPMQSQLLFFRLALSSLSVNFIAATQIISGDWPTFYYTGRSLCRLLRQWRSEELRYLVIASLDLSGRGNLIEKLEPAIVRLR